MDDNVLGLLAIILLIIYLKSDRAPRHIMREMYSNPRHFATVKTENEVIDSRLWRSSYGP